MGKPWFLLVPNYVYMKDFYESTLNSGPAGHMLYLCPHSRYLYESPKGVANALGETRKSGERKTAPFMSFWYIGASQQDRSACLALFLLFSFSWFALSFFSHCHNYCHLCA